MCHAKPRKRSRLLLSEVDHCLEPFFEGADKISMPSPSGTAAPFTDGVNNHPHSELGKLDYQHQLIQNPWGGSGPVGAEADLGKEAASQKNDNSESSHSPATMSASINREVATAPPDPPPKEIPRAGCRSAKRIRFTGAMGKFLDGSSMWSDVAIMEAERKANSATATAAAVENSHHQVGGGLEQTVEQEEDKEDDNHEEGTK